MDVIYQLFFAAMIVFWPVVAIQVWRDPSRDPVERRYLIRSIVGFELGSVSMLGFMLLNWWALAILGVMAWVAAIVSYPSESKSADGD